MADNQGTPTSPDRRPLDLSPNVARALLEQEKLEHRRLLRIFRLFRKTDELDSAIHAVIEVILSSPPSPEFNTFELEDVTDMIHGMPPLETILKPEFFSRITLPFRMLRLSLSMHLVNPVENNRIDGISLSKDELKNTSLLEQIWFLMFLGASNAQVESALAQYREPKTDAQASVAMDEPQRSRAPKDSRDAPSVANNYYGNHTNSSPQFNPSHSNISNLHARAPVSHGFARANLPPTSSNVRRSAATPLPVHLENVSSMQSKKGSAVESYFKDRRFTGAPEQSVDNTIRDFEICAVQQCLDHAQMSLFFVNALADPARQFFLTHCSPHMPYEDIVTHMRRHYNSESRKLQLQSEMDSLDLPSFMHKHQVTDDAEGLTKIVNHINALAPQLPYGFGDDPHKTRYLRRAVMRLRWSQQPISQLTTARYTFTQFITALHESLQLQEEIARARAPEINYGQYVNNPRDVSRFNNNTNGRENRWSHGRNNTVQGSRNRSRSPYGRYDRSRSPNLSYSDRARNRSSERRRNPNLHMKRFCWGCGSPDHILSDRKCTPMLETLRTNIVSQLDCDPSRAELAANQFMTLHSQPSNDPPVTSKDAPVRPSTTPSNVNFEESLYKAEDRDTFQSQIAAGFKTREHNIRFVSGTSQKKKVFDCSNIHLASGPGYNMLLAFCVDIGAPRSVIGRNQLNRVLKEVNRTTVPRIRSNNSFRFGDVTVHSLGMIEIALETPPHVRPIAVLMDIVPVDVPALLGLDVLDAEQLYADNVTNRLVHREVTSRIGEHLEYKDNWHVPLERHTGHLYAKMSFPRCTFYTAAQLQKLHRQFAHPSATKLYNLLKTAGLEAVDTKTLDRLQEIVSRCEPCQRIHNAPVRFRVSIGHEDVRFNARAYIDIMYLDGRPVLHIVDESTRFSAARFLPKVSTDAVWESIVLCWSSVYTGLPHHIMVDEGTQFRKIFAELSALHDVKLEKSGVQSHHSLGIGERYHKPLRDTYRKLKLDYPSMQRQLLLALAVKAMNDTLGPDGIVPSALVFGEFPSLRTLAGPVIPRASLAERAEAAQEARRLMAKHLAQVRVKRALKHNTPGATDVVFEPGEQVLVWREKIVENRIGEWVGPYTVTSFDEQSRIVLVQKDTDSPHERYNITQVKHFLEPEQAATDFFETLHTTLSSFASETVPVDVQMTEVIDKDDPRANSPEMREAINNEVQDLLRRGTFKVILKEELPDGANALTARFVLAIKSNADGQIKYKARYVMGGHRDRLKNYLVHGAQTLQASSTRLLLALAAIFGFDVWSSDVKLAYLQSSEPLERRVFIKNPAPEFELDPEECFELLRPLYGLSDAGDLWHKTLHKHLTEDLGLTPTKADPSLYLSFRNGELIGINGAYVDDLLRAGHQEFRKVCNITHERFETSGDETPPFTFAGFNITSRPDVPLAVDQTFYVKKLEELDHLSSFADFRSMRMRLAWLANTRPDLLFEISQLAQITQERFDSDAKAHLKRLNAGVRYAHVNVAHLKFPKLDRSSLRIVGYSDAAFSNNFDLTSQLGRIILLMDNTNAAIPILFKSYKSRRVTRSVLSAEVIAFADLFDDAFTLRSQIEHANGRAVPMHLLTDSKSLFDIISKGSRTSEKRIMLDIHAARQAYQSLEISNIGFVRSCDNIADGLTKGKMQKALFELLQSNTHTVNCEQWILR